LSDFETKPKFGVILFQSSQGAIGAEKMLEEHKIEYKLIPVPTNLSSNCGFCIRFKWEDREKIEKMLKKSNLGVEKILPI
jgi:hypothetical protein